MLLTKWKKGDNSLADLDPMSPLSLFDELWPSAMLENGRPFSPPMDVSETDNEYHVRVEIPGMEKDDISIEFENNVLTLSGEKQTTNEEKNEKVYRVERRYGSFLRSLRFADVDSEKVQATFKNGVLEIDLPKTELAKPKKIDIT